MNTILSQISPRRNPYSSFSIFYSSVGLRDGQLKHLDSSRSWRSGKYTWTAGDMSTRDYAYHSSYFPETPPEPELDIEFEGFDTIPLPLTTLTVSLPLLLVRHSSSQEWLFTLTMTAW